MSSQPKRKEVLANRSHGSIMAIYGEIPWLSYYTRFIPPATRDVKRVRQMAFSRTEKRYATGSTTRDLFYYLVRASTNRKSAGSSDLRHRAMRTGRKRSRHLAMLSSPMACLR